MSSLTISLVCNIDEKDNLYEFIKNNNERYYYIRDALGNILGIINQNGQIVVQYSYTSYGVCSISGNTSLGNENPFRYKGYYYDVETSLYYLTTRYYDPEIGRFISPDSVDYLDSTTINGLNLYAYCGNNPINKYDPTGRFAIGILILIIVGDAVLTTAGAITYGAVTDTPVVLDFSVSAGMGAGVGGKVGMSIVLDFKNDGFGFYSHYGYDYYDYWGSISFDKEVEFLKRGAIIL